MMSILDSVDGFVVADCARPVANLLRGVRKLDPIPVALLEFAYQLLAEPDLVLQDLFLPHSILYHKLVKPVRVSGYILHELLVFYETGRVSIKIGL